MRVSIQRTFRSLVGAIALAAAGLSSTAMAKELSFAIFHSKADAFSIAEDKWMSTITSKTNGRVTFKPAYSGSLVSLTEAFEAVSTGTVDVAVTAASVLSGRVRDVSPFEPVGAYPTGAAFGKMMEEAEPLLRDIFRPHNVMYLWSTGAPGVSNVCRGSHTKAPADYKGLKIRAAGRWQSAQVSALGGSPIVMDPGSLYQGLQTGTIDCAVITNNLILSFKLFEPARFITDLGMPVNLLMYIINEKTFNALSADDRAVIMAASREATAGAMQPVMKAQDEALEKIVAAGGSVYRLTDAERKAFVTANQTMYNDIRKFVGDNGRKLMDVLERHR